MRTITVRTEKRTFNVPRRLLERSNSPLMRGIRPTQVICLERISSADFVIYVRSLSKGNIEGCPLYRNDLGRLLRTAAQIKDSSFQDIVEMEHITSSLHTFGGFDVGEEWTLI